jgi:crossover junction endodeoxyribonuclease RuvC
VAIILGIDPGSRVVGFAVVESDVGNIGLSISTNSNGNANGVRYLTHGVIELDTKVELVYRLAELGEAIHELLQRYRPSELAIENVFMGKNADSAFKLGQARGVIIYECVKAGLSVGQYAPREVKKGVTGSGSAEKEDVFHVLERAMGVQLSKAALDASDALAIAFHHAAQLRTKTRVLSRLSGVDM